MEQQDHHLGTVRRRRVFYIPGYDPFHPRRYRELYRKEATAQARISGYDISLLPKAKRDAFGWRVSSTQGGQTVEADISVLYWADIVQNSMNVGVLGTYWQMLRTAWTYMASSVVWRLAMLRIGPLIAALYPLYMLIGQLCLAIGLGIFVGLSAEGLLLRVWPSGWGAGLLVRFAAVICIAWAVLNWFCKKDSKFLAYYLMHDFAFSARWGGAYPSALEARLQDFRARITAALAGEYDEVLVVGHSSGVHLGVSVLADMLRDGLPAPPPHLAFLSLGHVVPMVSFLKDAQRLRGDLADLSMADGMTWVDVTAPGDGCTFALCDPVAVTGMAQPGQKWPLVISAAFTQSLSPARWKELRWRFFRLHFQYLCAFDAPKDYDYFAITAGPMTLADRYRWRGHSRSRFGSAVSKYQDRL